MQMGFIKLHRKLLEWDYSNDPIVLSLFIHLLLLCNWEDKTWKGVLVKRGQAITSKKSLARSVGVSYSQIRRAIEVLIDSNQITMETTNRYSIVTVCKYDDYQSLQDLHSNQTATKTATKIDSNQNSTLGSNQTATKIGNLNDCKTSNYTENENLNNENTATDPATNSRPPKEKKKRIRKKSTQRATSARVSDLSNSEFGFSEPESASSLQELDRKQQYSRILSVYDPSEFDPGIGRPSTIDKQSKLFMAFSQEERDKIVQWFEKYAPNLMKKREWLSGFFNDKSDLDTIANYFRSVSKFNGAPTKEKSHNETRKQLPDYKPGELTTIRRVNNGLENLKNRKN